MHRQSSFLGDLVRLPLALVAWNWRKTMYRVRGARGRCPCQHPSDSGSAGETGCEACVDWNSPARFRWVCPLLVPGKHGWHCSVHAPEVRPFWGRAVLIFASGLLALHLAGSTLAWIGLRATGVEGARWVDVVRPTHWHKLTEARSRYFTARAARLLQQTDFIGAELSLLSAMETNPDNYEAALFLAHLRQYQQNYGLSDAIFRRLLDQFPDRTQQTAVAWHDALLMRQRYRELAELSLRMAEGTPQEMAPWLRSALLAVRQGRIATEVVRRNASLIAKFPALVRALLTAEDLLQRESGEGAVRLLLEGAAAPMSPFLAVETIEELLRLNARDQAEVVWRRQAPNLPAFERDFARMRIDQAAGDAALVRLDFAALLQNPEARIQTARLAAWLVEFPDRRSFERLDSLLQPAASRTVVTGAEVWLAALACGAEEAAVSWARFCSAQRGIRVPEVRAIDFVSDSMANPASVPRIIAIGRLPREVIYGLLRRAAAEQRAVGAGK